MGDKGPGSGLGRGFLGERKGGEGICQRIKLPGRVQASLTTPLGRAVESSPPREGATVGLPGRSDGRQQRDRVQPGRPGRGGPPAGGCPTGASLESSSSLSLSHTAHTAILSFLPCRAVRVPIRPDLAGTTRRDVTRRTKTRQMRPGLDEQGKEREREREEHIWPQVHCCTTRQHQNGTAWKAAVRANKTHTRKASSFVEAGPRGSAAHQSPEAEMPLLLQRSMTGTPAATTPRVRNRCGDRCVARPDFIAPLQLQRGRVGVGAHREQQEKKPSEGERRTPRQGPL
ncbi:hypothetical protein VDGL01_12346 [Verticillium dahliae]